MTIATYTHKTLLNVLRANPVTLFHGEPVQSCLLVSTRPAHGKRDLDMPFYKGLPVRGY